jgi:hypothetical protein
MHWFERHVYPAYCARSVPSSWLPTVARCVALALSGVIAVLVRPRFVRWLVRAPLAQVASTAVALIAALVVGDVLVRRLPHGDRTPLVRTDLPRAVADPVLGYRFLPSQTVIGGAEYAIDADGNRAASQGSRIDPDAPTVVLAGESIAFGESVAWRDGIAARLGQSLHQQVVDLGVPAYSVDQTYHRLAESLPRLPHVTTIVVTMIPQSIRRESANPRGLARLWRDEPYHDDSHLDHVRARLAQIAELARGARVLFVLANYGADCVDPDPWFVHALFDTQPPLPFLRVYLPPEQTVGGRDFHPNAHGAAMIAAAIELAL